MSLRENMFRGFVDYVNGLPSNIDDYATAHTGTPYEDGRRLAAFLTASGVDVSIITEDNVWKTFMINRKNI